MTVTTFFDHKKDGLFARLRHGVAAVYKGIIEAREAEAERYVNGCLATLDDEALRRMGRTRAELANALKLSFYV